MILLWGWEDPDQTAQMRFSNGVAHMRVSISDLSTLLLFQINRLFYYMINPQHDIHDLMVFQCHHPRTEELRALCFNPIVNHRFDFFIRPELASMIFFFFFFLVQKQFMFNSNVTEEGSDQVAYQMSLIMDYGPLIFFTK